MENIGFISWNYLEKMFFHQQLLKSTDGEPADLEGRQYTVLNWYLDVESLIKLTQSLRKTALQIRSFSI